jgi:hypothetical protein
MALVQCGTRPAEGMQIGYAQLSLRMGAAMETR